MIRVSPTEEEHVKLLNDLESNDVNFDVWNSVRKQPVSFDVSLPPISFLKYKALFESENIKFEILNRNLQSEISAQKKQMEVSKKRDSSILFKYARYQEVNSK